MNKNSLILFNQDLRISDNPTLFAAAKNSENILPLFILDEKNKRTLGEASKWFLHHALKNLSTNFKEKYSLKLITKKGCTLKILDEIFDQNNFDKLYFNESLEPYNIKLEEQIKNLAKKHKIEVFSLKSQTLFDPEKIKNGSGNYYKVFTPFWRECLKKSSLVTNPLKTPDALRGCKINIQNDELDLLPKINWYKDFEKTWKFDEKKIRKDFADFLKNKIHNYHESRNIPALEGCSKLSSYLHFGIISVREIFYLVTQIEPSLGQKQFLAELGWREFCHHLLFHFPQLPEKNFKSEFDKFPWIEDKKSFEKWTKGQTGFPIVDAGMRELWATGFMHNRLRMIVASFLIKHLLIDWREGEKWFWNCLVDANLANNCANWQWVAGSGADAAPYFRIFNPTIQGERFDPDCEYIKKWLPELKNLDAKMIHKISEIDEKILKSRGVELGKNYPKQIVNHAKARDMALTIFKTLKS